MRTCPVCWTRFDPSGNEQTCSARCGHLLRRAQQQRERCAMEVDSRMTETADRLSRLVKETAPTVAE